MEKVAENISAENINTIMRLSARLKVNKTTIRAAVDRGAKRQGATTLEVILK